MNSINCALRTALLAFMASTTGECLAQGYPARPVRIIVGFSAGGTTDVVARMLTPGLTETWGKPVVVDNRPGVTGSLAAELVARAPADGHTLLVTNSAAVTINPVLYPKLAYDIDKDLAPVTFLLTSPLILVAHPSLPVRSVKELIQLAKAHPGKLKYSSGGIGNLQHIALEVFQFNTGTQLTHIPYKGGAPAMIDLLAGQVELNLNNIIASLPLIKSGKVRALGTSSLKRTPALPDVPAISETVPGYEFTAWTGVLAPAQTPRETINKIHADLVKLVERPEIREKFSDQGAYVVGSTPEQFNAIIRKELALFSKVIKAAQIRLD